jgi:hypothetical protein
MRLLTMKIISCLAEVGMAGIIVKKWIPPWDSSILRNFSHT